MVSILLNKNEKEFLLESVLKTRNEINRNYHSIKKQIDNFLRDLLRFMIKSNDQNINDLLENMNYYCDDIFKCKQKLSVFKINNQIIDSIFDFLSCFFNQLWDLLGALYETDEDGWITETESEDFLKQKTILNYLINNVIMQVHI